MVEIALGLGIVLSLVLTETLGVTAGGLIVPGYIALYLHDPLRVIGTFAVSLIVFGIVRLLSFRMFIFGKRRLVICLLLGFLLGALSKQYLFFAEEALWLLFLCTHGYLSRLSSLSSLSNGLTASVFFFGAPQRNRTA